MKLERIRRCLLLRALLLSGNVCLSILYSLSAVRSRVDTPRGKETGKCWLESRTWV